MSAYSLAKSAKEKGQNDNDLCKKHAPRCDKDNNRSTCPSKLSKRELEDLYYSLLENNLELKRTINAANEKNRILSTKVQRITTQTKTYMGKDCCAAGKAVINEQKAALADLNKANEALADRVRRLSTQLCTAKQFLKQNPNARHCYKCFANTTTSVKNLSTTSLQNKSSNVILKSAAASAIQLDQEPPSTRAAETNTIENYEENDVKGDTDNVCNENRCRTTMEHFKQKIGDLEEELAKTHAEYSTRMTQLEAQVSQLQSSALRARSEQSVRSRGELELARRQQRAADQDRAELDTELSIEKKKVAELEMRLKAAEWSQQVSQTVEEHLSTASRLEEKQLRQTSVDRCDFCSNVVTGDLSPQSKQTMTPTKTSNQLTVPDYKMSKSDDSGYADHRQESDIDDKNTNKTNQELMKMIEDMQAQLDALKLITAEKSNAELEASPCSRTFDQYYSKSDEDQEIKDDEKFLPKHTHISISEPVRGSKELITETNENQKMFISERRKSTVSDKLNPINKTDIPPKDFEHPSKDNVERNDSGISNLRGESTSDKEQTVVICECPNDNRENLENNDSICENHEYNEHSKIYANSSIKKQDILKACSSKEPGDPENIQSIRFQHAVGSIERKPNPDDVDNASVTSSTPAKRKRASVVIFENKNGTSSVSCEMEPESITSNIQKDYPPEPSKSKTEDCNFQQITGPSSVSRKSTGKGRVSPSEKKAEYDGKNANIEGQNSGKTRSIEQYPNKDLKNDQDERNNVGRNVDLKDNALKKFEDKYVYDNSNKKGLIIDVQCPEYKKDDQDINSLIHIPNQKELREIGTLGVGSNVLAEYKTAKDILKRGDYEYERLQNGYSAKMNEIPKIQEFDICQHHATICSCPEKPGPSLGLLRSCSGSQTLAALPAGSRFRRCSCSERPARFFGPTLKDKPVGTSTPKADRAPTLTSPHTYTIDSGKSRADSPANTDNEISVMTDLPSEKDDTYDRLSPGERRPNGVSTETGSYRGLTLSEGEVPGHQERRTSKSLGEIRRTDYEKESTSYGEQKSPAEKMESTLLAISQELARCRSLLLSQRPTEQKDAASGSDYRECALRKTPAKARIDGTVVPTCLFIMHVVSVVFSDEAVLGAHNTHLMLTWQFADCKPIVVPLKADRVVHFDFSTQQEVQMTREVVDYLKKEVLLIRISAMDNVNNNIASCTLPFLQVLLNINDIINLSLPLKAGPYLRANAPDTSNTGDDVGVLDMSCMLFCEEGQLASYTENPKNPFNAEQLKEKNPSATEARQHKFAARQASFQRHPFMVPSDQSSSPRDAEISLERRHQVEFEVPRDRHERNIPLLQYYEKSHMKRNGATSNRQSTMSSSRISKSGLPDSQVIEITILWLTLNENIESMLPKDRKLYVAYTFLGRDGAELETPISVPRPLHYADKCIFNYCKSFNLTEMEMRVLEHMVSCRSQNRRGHNSNDCIVFTVVSEPPEDPLGLDNCEDIGFAFLYLGDLLAYCSGDSFTEVLPVRGAHGPARACGVLAVRLRGLEVLRECRQRTS